MNVIKRALTTLGVIQLIMRYYFGAAFGNLKLFSRSALTLSKHEYRFRRHNSQSLNETMKFDLEDVFHSFQTSKQQNVIGLYRILSSHCLANSVVDSEVSVRMIICHVLQIGYRLSDFNSHQKLLLSESQLLEIRQMCERRLRAGMQ